MRAAPRHFLDLKDFSGPDLRRVLHIGADLKARRRKDRDSSGEPPRERPLAGKILAMVFDKPSTRTRVSFDMAMRELGGETVVLTGGEMQLGRGETIADTARVLSRFVDAIMIRTLQHKDVIELARHATVPVINGLTKKSHPTQVMADVLTFEEHRGPIKGRRISWCGDGNNVLHSLLHAAAAAGMHLAVATPPGYEPDPGVVAEANQIAQTTGARLSFFHDPEAAVRGADAVYTDVWASMGQEEEKERRIRDFQGFQVDANLMSRAKGDALFLHCLPAYRGLEVSEEVIDGPRSVVFDQAENRLHAQKALLLTLLG